MNLGQRSKSDAAKDVEADFIEMSCFDDIGLVFGLDMGTCHALRRTAAQFSTGFRFPDDG
jgi:hypothetical protein